jgi:choline dehydrogenase
MMLWLSDPRGDPPIFEIDVVLLRPRARGTVRLRSRDPAEPPLIGLPDRCDPIDIERLAEGYLRGLDVATQPRIRSLCSAPPSPNTRQSAELRDVIRADAYHFPHVVGTCSMGPWPDAGGVVDASGGVHGTDGVSVVDASIVPNGPSAFTHLPTVMLAERLSEQLAGRL